MQKRVDIADISVLIFLIAVLIFWLYTRKETINTVVFSTVLKAKNTVLLALCYSTVH